MRRRIFLFVIVYGTMAIYGFIENLKGVTYPLIKTSFGVTYDQQGILVSVLSFAYVCFCAVGGLVIARFGIKWALLGGYAAMLLGLVSVFFVPGYYAVGAALFMVGAAFGLFDVGVNALGTQVFTSKAALLMNLLHFFYGLGSTASPRIAGAISSNLNWRYVYLLVAPVLLIFFVPAIFTRFPDQQNRRQETAGTVPHARHGSFTAVLKDPMVWIFSVALGFMVVVEVASANWAGLYFLDVYGIDPAGSGAGFLSNFFICFTLSRLLSGFLIEKIGYLRSLMGAALGVLAVLALGFALGARGLYILPLLGLFVAIFWPTTMAVAMGHFGPAAPVVTSVMIVIAGILNSVVQLLMGLTNRLLGPAWGYRSCFVYGLLVVISLLALRRKIKFYPR
jgi:fucose permease